MLTFSLQLSTKKSDVEHILEQKSPLVRRKVDRKARKRQRTLRFLHTEPLAVLSDSENRHQKKFWGISKSARLFAHANDAQHRLIDRARGRARRRNVLRLQESADRLDRHHRHRLTAPCAVARDGRP